MDSSYPPAPQRSPSQHFSSDPFSRGGSISHLSSYTPTTEQSPFASSGPKNYQDPTENPYFRRQSVVEYAARDPHAPPPLPLPSSSSSMPVPKEEDESPNPDDDMHMKSEHDEDDDWRPHGASVSSASGGAGAGRGRGRKREIKDDPDDVLDDSVGLDTNPDGIEVKTKFPVARIKRIMQADEDVGKVAQVTPVAVSKALELFMISIITSAASEARQRGQKRVGAAHLKQTIIKNAKFDFLSEIAERVPDATAKNAGSGDEGKGKAKGRRKKKDDGD